MATDKKTVLIVDDEQSNIFALSAVLIPRGFTCTAALNGEQCLNILSERTAFDIILMDIMMPFMDGIETIQMIRELPQYKNTKIIVITADDNPALRLRSMAVGANGFLNKPIDVDKLVALF
ncbi:response regulator [Adhaeribacter aquaticus]|uniref:response regulator n=1 Tax=Adhaeribacter aquaticus TaxID=299567 RepID=UPI00041FB6A8|nr:response regulator [Adhaeribacter aquaticus]